MVPSGTSNKKSYSGGGTLKFTLSKEENACIIFLDDLKMFTYNILDRHPHAFVTVIFQNSINLLSKTGKKMFGCKRGFIDSSATWRKETHDKVRPTRRTFTRGPLAAIFQLIRDSEIIVNLPRIFKKQHTHWNKESWSNASYVERRRDKHVKLHFANKRLRNQAWRC